MRQVIEKGKSLILLSYAKEDFNRVKDLYDRLKADGLHPWMDRPDLPPGKRWAHEISQVLRGCRAVLVCLSRNSVKSVRKKRFLKDEIEKILFMAEAKPEGTDFIFPVRLVNNLDITRIPKLRDISEWNAVDLFRLDGYDRLHAVLKDLPDASNISAGKPRPLTLHGASAQHHPGNPAMLAPKGKMVSSHNREAWHKWLLMPPKQGINPEPWNC